MRNLVVTVILGSVLAYFAAKFYLHYEVTSGLDSAISQIKPFADIRYEGVSSTLTGRLSIDGIGARFGNFNDRLMIDRANIITPSFLHLLKLDDTGRRLTGSDAALPESLGFVVDGMRAKVSDDFVTAFLNAARAAAPKIAKEDVAAKCVGKYGYSSAALRDLGYDDIVMSLSMAYRQEHDKLLFDVFVDL